MKRLSPKERRFVAEYIKKPKGGPAAVRAGYSKRSADQIASRLLRKDKVRQEVDAKIEKITDDCVLEAKDVIKRFTDLATFDLAAAFHPDGTLKKIHEMPAAVAAAISSFELDDAGVEIKKVKFIERTKALEMIGKYLKMFVERTELTDGAGAPVIIQMISAEYDATKNNQGSDHKSL